MTRGIEADASQLEGGRISEVAGDVAVSGFMQSDREDDRHGENRDHLSDLIEFHGRPARSNALFYQSRSGALRVLPVMPYGFQIAGQLRQRTEIGPALPLAVVIGAARGGEAEFARYAGEFEILLRRVASGHDLDPGAPAVPELRKERAQLGLGKVVAARVRDDGDSAACADPAHGVR